MVSTDTHSRGLRQLTIGMPLRSERNTPDWPLTCRMLKESLVSIANQSMPVRRVIIACHEIPPIDPPAGLEVEFVQVDFERPAKGQGSLDSRRKRDVVGARHRAHGGGLLFLLDADDLIARDFVATIGASKAKAMLLKSGYQLDKSAGTVMRLPRFWRRCGSCAVVDWRPEELPAGPDDAGSTFTRFLQTRHFRWHELLRQWGWETEFITQPVALYVVGHGQNISLAELDMSWKWWLYNRFFPRRRVTPDFLARFGMAG